MLVSMTSAARRTTGWARLLLLLLACVWPVVMLGCMKATSSNAVYAEAPAGAAGAYDEYGGSYGTGGDGADYDYQADMIDTMAVESPAPPSRDRWAGNKQKAEKERSGKDDMFKSAPEEPAPDTKPTTEGQPAPLEAPTDTPKQPAPVAQKRQIIYTASMQVSVFDLEHSLEIVESLPDRYGGWLHQRVDNQVVLRIPAERLAEAMATVAELGVVDYRLLESLDVTAEYTDLESRIHILSEMQKRLQALLAKATTVEQALEIRRALDQITLELEAARAQMRELSKSIAFSTLILSLVERGPTQLVPSSNDPFPWVDELGVEATGYQ
jgi:hypothetical protein